MRRWWIVVAIAALAAAGIRVDAAAETRESQLKPPFKKVWEFTPKGDFNSLNRILTVRGAVCYAAAKSFGAVDLANGRELWGKPYSSDYSGSDLAADGKLLYVAIGKRKLLACDPRTGREVWSVPSKAEFTRLAVAKGVLYCQLREGFLTALNLKTRKPIWTVNLEPANLPKNKRTAPYTSSNILLSQGRLFVGTSAGDLVCLSAKTGKTAWRYRIPGKENYATGVVADGERVYSSTRDDQIIALKVSSGKKVWKFDPDVEYAQGNPPCLLAATMMMSSGGQLHALNASNGSPIRTQPLSPLDQAALSPPVERSRRVLLTNESRIVCFDASGQQAWDWDTEEELRGDPIRLLRDGFLLTSGGAIYCFGMGEGPKLPDTADGRLALAKTLVARLDTLTKDERRTLSKLGDEAFVTLLPALRERVAAHETKVARNPDADTYEAVSKLGELALTLARTASKERTPQMIEFSRETKTQDVRRTLLGWLVDCGDEEQRIPFFLAALKNGRTEDDSLFGASLTAVSCSRTPQALSFLIEQLGDPNADTAIRHAAFCSLSSTGGEAGVKVVLAARDTRRDIPSLYDFMGLEKLSPTIKEKSEEFQWPWLTLAELLETGRDNSGALWGLMSCRAVGFIGDLWVARRDGDKWAAPIFTDVSAKELGNRDWVKLFCGNTALANDSDGDGWSDLVEKRLGTNPTKADTDADGLADSKDMNPLAAPRELTEAERVLAAAFQARFQFGGGRDAVCVVELPKGVEPFELVGWGWITICVKAGTESPLEEYTSKGIGKVSFRLPASNFAGGSLRGREKKDGFILWNEDRTEAKVQLSTRYGGLDGTGFDMRLRKFGDQWLVIDMEMVWIS